MVPAKTCTLDCLFCEVGPTSALASNRREYVPLAEVLGELRDWTAAGGDTDFVTVAGSGEPTLHTGFGEVLAFVAGETRFRSALLTNGTLLYLPDVRAAAARASVVKATLSAWDEPSFRALHRPHPDITFARLLEGIRAFRGAYAGELWLEVFLVPGINANPADVRRIADLVNPLAPARVHLNTVIRPPAHPGTAACSAEELEALAGLFAPRAEVTAPFQRRAAAGGLGREAILAMLRRRPCTESDLVHASGLNAEDARRLLADLESAGLVRSETHGGARYYTAP
jgi:wyosine [tRNA(Phe)-imidazoG37] synthetase (radical SAM superfamily)